MDIEAFRREFPVVDRWVFLDHAAVAAPPRRCAAVIAEHALDMANNGIGSYPVWADRIRRTRASAAELIGARPHDVCFVGSTTHGIGIVAEGFPWKPGDNVVSAAEEYPSNQYPWMNLRDRGVEFRPVPSRGNRIAVEDLIAAVDERTRLLAISSVEFGSGFRNDLVQLGTWCRQRGIFLFVDAIQSLGVFPMNVADLPIDALSADSHKWMLGPEGAGIAWVRPEWIDRLHPVGVGWNSVVESGEFSTIDFRLKPHAGRWEGGTLNVGGLCGMGESIRLLLQAGVTAIEARVLELTDYLCDRWRSNGGRVFSSRDGKDRSGIVSVAGLADPKVTMRRCREAGIIVNVRSGRLRVSPHFYNTFEELDRFVDVASA